MFRMDRFEGIMHYGSSVIATPQHHSSSIDLRYEMIVTSLLKHEMHMARPVAMTLKLSKELANRAIVGNRIRNRHDSLEPEESIFVTLHHGSLVWTFTSWVLHVVVAFAVGLPDVDLDILNGLAIRVFDGAEN